MLRFDARAGKILARFEHGTAGLNFSFPLTPSVGRMPAFSRVGGIDIPSANLTADASSSSSGSSSSSSGLWHWHNESDGRWARLLVDPNTGAISGLVHAADELFVLRAAEMSSHGRVLRFAELPRSPAWHAMDALLAARRARRRHLQGGLPSGPPYGRLAGCPLALRVLRLGLVADAGFTGAAGGASAAYGEIAAALHLLNGLFEDQLGLRIEARYLILSPETPSSASFALHGPNGGNGARPRAADLGRLMTAPGEQPQVLDIGPSYLLGRFSQWVGAHAPDSRGRVGLWHLLTDAFPPPGVVGLAPLGSACTLGAQEIEYEATGTAAPPGYLPRTDTGRRVLTRMRMLPVPFTSPSGPVNSCR